MYVYIYIYIYIYLYIYIYSYKHTQASSREAYRESLLQTRQMLEGNVPSPSSATAARRPVKNSPKVSLLFMIPCKMTVQLTFEKFHWVSLFSKTTARRPKGFSQNSADCRVDYRNDGNADFL